MLLVTIDIFSDIGETESFPAVSGGAGLVRAIIGFAIVSVLAFLSFTAAPSASASHPEDVTILVGDFWFCEPAFQSGMCITDIQAGATVTWDFSPMSIFEIHTTTELSGTPLWDSGNVGPGPGGPGDPTSYTFNTPGVYSYTCTVHPFTMNGQINVGSVGGIAEIVEPAGLPLDAGESSSGPSIAIIFFATGAAVALAAGLGSAGWHIRRRLR